jgi:hypothetical protein
MRLMVQSLEEILISKGQTSGGVEQTGAAASMQGLLYYPVRTRSFLSITISSTSDEEIVT